MPERVFLHVGSPKTGTTFLQKMVWAGRRAALEQGLLLPLGTFYDHFLASVDLRGKSLYGPYPPLAIGIWERLADEARAWKGDVLVSHELFAGATAEQARTAVQSFGDADVHVIITARDLERQIPAEWQEHIKHRSTATFTDFVHDLETLAPESEWFWTVQDYADVCRRWGAAIPPGNTHVVTVPAGERNPDLLWQRFAGLIGLDLTRFEVLESPANTSLHAEQAELLRRLNLQLGDRLPLPGPYPQTVKDVLAQSVLAARPGTLFGLAGDDRKFAVNRSQMIVDELSGLGVDVVGDLSELVPPQDPPPNLAATDVPEATSDAVLLGEGLDAITGLLERLAAQTSRAGEAQSKRQRAESELSRCRGELAALQTRHHDLQASHEGLVHDMHQRPVRHLVIGLSEAKPWLMKLRVGYWRTANLVRRIAQRGGE